MSRPSDRRAPGRRAGWSPRLALLVAGALAVAGASCGGSKPAGPSTSAASPLDALVSSGTGSADQSRIQDAIAECMRAKGWAYTPVVQGTGVAADTIDEATFQARYGYGISLSPDIATTSNPNATYVAGLSASEAARYMSDLVGDTGADASGENAAGGCVQKGATSVQATGAGQDPKLRERVETLEAEIDRDPAMAAAITRWSACMRERGFDYTTPDAIVKELTSRAAAQGIGPGAATPVGGAVGQPATTAGTATSAATAHDGALAALQREELAIAAADGTCAADNVAPVRRKLEEEAASKLRSEFPSLSGHK